MNVVEEAALGKPSFTMKFPAPSTVIAVPAALVATVVCPSALICDDLRHAFVVGVDFSVETNAPTGIAGCGRPSVTFQSCVKVCAFIAMAVDAMVKPANRMCLKDFLIKKILS